MYKQISSRVILDHPRLTLIEDIVELPNGKHGDYLKWRNKGHAVTVLCRDDRGRLLVEKEYSYVPDTDLYQFPGGGIGLDERPEDGANRELVEEVGLRAGRLTLLGTCYLNHRKSDELMFVFLGEDPEPATTDVLDEYEGEIQQFWMMEAEIGELIARGEIMNASMLSAWAIYTSARGR